MNVLPVWKKGFTGHGVVVSILDDGIDHTHPDLKKNYVSVTLYKLRIISLVYKYFYSVTGHCIKTIIVFLQNYVWLHIHPSGHTQTYTHTHAQTWSVHYLHWIFTSCLLFCRMQRQVVISTTEVTWKMIQCLTQTKLATGLSH